jgi:hypothetical protein
MFALLFGPLPARNIFLSPAAAPAGYAYSRNFTVRETKTFRGAQQTT